jgi:hypothetical protein
MGGTASMTFIFPYWWTQFTSGGQCQGISPGTGSNYLTSQTPPAPICPDGKTLAITATGANCVSPGSSTVAAGPNTPAPSSPPSGGSGSGSGVTSTTTTITYNSDGTVASSAVSQTSGGSGGTVTLAPGATVTLAPGGSPLGVSETGTPTGAGALAAAQTSLDTASTSRQLEIEKAAGTGKKNELGFTWSPEMPTASCTALTLTFKGYAGTYDWCAKLDAVQVWVAWFYGLIAGIYIWRSGVGAFGGTAKA